MALIQVTPDMLRSKARELRNLRGQHDDSMNQIRSLVNGINDQWKGEAQQAYVDKFNSMEGTFKQFTEMLENFALLMESSANTIEQADIDSKNRINQA